MKYKYFNDSQRQFVLLFGKQKGLSPRQTEVYIEIISGYSNEHIRKKLHTSVQTVKFHITNIYKILKVTNRVQLLWIMELKDFIQLEKLQNNPYSIEAERSVYKKKIQTQLPTGKIV